MLHMKTVHLIRQAELTVEVNLHILSSKFVSKGEETELHITIPNHNSRFRISRTWSNTSA